MSETFAPHEVQRSGTTVAEVLRPASLADALDLINEDPTRRLIAGGTDLLLEFARSHDLGPQTIVDLTGIDGFAEIAETDEHLVLAGGVTHAQVVADQRIVTSALPLAQACLEVGSPQWRNRATIAGNLATASPANDTISALMALDAQVVLASLDSDGAIAERTVSVADFFTGFRQTQLRPNELIREIRVPKLTSERRGMWFKVGLRKNQAISVVHGGVVLTFDGDQVREARLALGSVAPTVVLVPQFGDVLSGARLSPELANMAASAAAQAISPISDGRATAEYRRSVVESVVQRALTTLADGDEASTWPASPPTLSTPRPHRTSPTIDSITVETPVEVVVNGETISSAGAANNTLLDWLREQHSDQLDDGLTGVKEGCAEGECGACTVLLDGDAVMSCLVSAAQADGAAVTTVEGIGQPNALHAIQEAFVGDFAVQCGFCIPGFIVAAARLLDEVAEPTREQIEHGLGGNLCRCTGYYPMVEAIQNAAEVRRKEVDT